MKGTLSVSVRAKDGIWYEGAAEWVRAGRPPPASKNAQLHRASSGWKTTSF